MWIPLLVVLTLAGIHGSLFEDIKVMERQYFDIRTCITNLTTLNFIEKENIMYSNWNLNVFDVVDTSRTLVTQVYNLEQKYQIMVLRTFKRYTAYVLVTTPGLFALHLNVMISMVRWNARAKFIILLEGEATVEVWQELANAFVIHVVVVQTDDMQLFTYDPYKYENLKNPHLESIPLGVCGNFDTLTGSLQRSKLPKHWRNTTILVGYVPVNPYIRNVTEGTGLEVELVNTLMSEYMKYKVIILEKEFLDWGVYFPKNYTYGGSVGAIQRAEIDFAIGHFHLREPERVIDFDTTFSYMDDDIAWVVPSAPVRSHWSNMIHIFDKLCLILTVISMVLSCITWQFFNRVSPGVPPAASQYYRSTLRCMEIPIISFLGFPIMYEPRTFSLRFLFLIIALTYFNLTTAWKSYIILSLTHNTSEYQIQNLKEIIEKGYTLAIYHELIDLHCADQTPEGDYVCRIADRNLCDASHRCLTRTAFQRDCCTIATKRILRYMSPQKFRTSTGQEMLYLFKKNIAKDYTVQYYRRGSPLFQRTSEFLMWIRTSGFSDNFDNRLDHTVQLAFMAFMRSGSKYQTDELRWQNVHGIFSLLGAGLLGSLILFVFEILYHSIMKHRDYFRLFVARSTDEHLQN